jgi:hypothetical protein
MTSSSDAAEQVVRLSLEGFEVVAKLSGEAAKNIALLLISALKQEQKTKGKARLTNMIKSGKELKVFTVQKKDLKEFTKHAKKYGVLYTVLRDKNNKNNNAVVDIIARADDASKIQRIIDRFDLATVDKGTIIKQAEKAIKSRKEKTDSTKNEKSDNDELFADIFDDESKSKKESKHITQEKQQDENPSFAKTEKSPPSEQNLTEVEALSNEGAVTENKKPSVREKLDDLKKQKNSDKAIPIIDEKKKFETPLSKTVHQQTKIPKVKER